MVAILPTDVTAWPRVDAPIVAVDTAFFDPDRFGRNAKHLLELSLGGPAADIRLPLLLIRGAEGGPRLVVTAGVHGDEYEGVRAVLDVCAALEPGEMRGDVLAVSVCHPPAFWGGTRCGPDGVNLARALPGRLDGQPTEAIAYHLARAVIARADFLLDLHSAGVALLMPAMVGYDDGDPRSREAAVRFGARVVWAHPRVAPGRTISFAAERGIPWLYTEASGGGRIDAAELEMFERGTFNLLRHLGILPGEAPPVAVDHHLVGDGDSDAAVRAAVEGFFVPHVDLLEHVAAGQLLAMIVDLHGRVRERVLAPASGVVALLRAHPVVAPGAPLCLLAELCTDGGPQEGGQGA